MAGAPTLGSQLRVNTFTADNQDSPAIATDANGNFIVVWESEDQDGNGSGIYAQRYDRNGNPLGSEFRVNTFTNGNQAEPTVAMDAAGNFVIAWVDTGRPYVIDGGTGTTRDENGIYARRFNRDGVPLGTEFLADREQVIFPNDAVPAFFGTDIDQPAIAMDADGDFVMTWRFFSDLLGNINARRFNRNGVPQGTAFEVNTTTDDRQTTPDVAMDADGDFVITWVSYGQESEDESFGIFAQRFTNTGSKQGSEFQVNTSTINAQLNPAIAMDSSGNFVIVWEDNDGSNEGIAGQRFSRLGSRQGQEFTVNNVDFGIQFTPDVAIDANGNFVVTWSDYLENIYAQRFTRTGQEVGTSFKVNRNSTGDQYTPVVAMSSEGNFAIAWSNTDDLDGSGNGVFAQRFQATMLLGTSGDDRLIGTPFDDNLDGLAGNDRIFGLAGDDDLLGRAGNDTLSGSSGNDTLYGGGGSDTLTGSAGADSLLGQAGNDDLNGGAGVDNLNGGAGSDELDGAAGRDRLTGGSGRDRFVLKRRQGRDTIVDFADRQDKILLGSGLSFDDLTISQRGGNTLISVGREQLAIVLDVSASRFTSADFITA